MTTVGPSDTLIRSARIRDNVSVGPPAANGTTIVMGFVGYACALAIRDSIGSAEAPAAKRRNFRWGSRMGRCSPECLPATLAVGRAHGEGLAMGRALRRGS